MTASKQVAVRTTTIPRSPRGRHGATSRDRQRHRLRLLADRGGGRSDQADLIDNYQAGDPSSSFLFVADPMRPNGGILMRFKGIPTIPLLNIPFYGAAPTGSAVLNDVGTPGDPSDDIYVYPTVGIAQQYDGCGLRRFVHRI